MHQTKKTAMPRTTTVQNMTATMSWASVYNLAGWGYEPTLPVQSEPQISIVKPTWQKTGTSFTRSHIKEQTQAPEPENLNFKFFSPILRVEALDDPSVLTNEHIAGNGTIASLSNWSLNPYKLAFQPNPISSQLCSRVCVESKPYIHTYTYTYMRVCICIYPNICKYKCVSTNMSINVNTNKNSNMKTIVRVCMYIYTHINMHKL